MSGVISIIDYGVGNIGAIRNMIRRFGGESEVVSDITGVSSASKLLLPGVGSFDYAMHNLVSRKLDAAIRDRALSGVPLLGICLGMQLLGESSEEGSSEGLGLVPGRVRKFHFEVGSDSACLKVPHMGWNTVVSLKQHVLNEQIGQDSRFYFVHSYYFDCGDTSDALLSTSYGYPFVSAVQRGSVMGVQFHPEKSHRFGMQLLKNFWGM